MVTLNQVQAGASRYIENEFLSKLTGWQKWAFGAGASLVLRDLTGTFDRVKSAEIVQMMNIIDEGGNIDIDTIYARFKEQARKGPVTFNVPLIGPVTLDESDVDKIYQAIVC